MRVGRDPGAPDDVEFLDFGSSEDGHRQLGHRRSRRWWWMAAGVLVAALAVTAVVRSGGHRSSPPSARTGPSSTVASSPSRVLAPSTGLAPPPVSVADVSPALLGVSASWELFGLGNGVLVRVELARGRITTTTLPALRSEGPVSLVVTADRALIRPFDVVPGYVVVDGQPAQPMSDGIARSGPMFPGPLPAQVWVPSDDDQRPRMTLRDADGGALGRTIPLPGTAPPEADGLGYLLVPATGGVYRALPSGLQRITTGSLLAVGPTGWLVVDCDDQHRCRRTLIDGRTGDRRDLGATSVEAAATGVLSPDGAIAVLPTLTNDGQVTLHRLDLATGVERPLDVAVNESIDATMTFSPDGRWLFVVGPDGQLTVVDARTGQGRRLPAVLPPLRQVTIRPAP